MRKLIIAITLGAAAAVAVPLSSASAHPHSGRYGTQGPETREELRECRRELRRADNRREYRRELRECRRELRDARRDDARRGYAGRRDGAPYGNAWGYRAQRDRYYDRDRRYRNRDGYDRSERRRYWDGYRWRYRY